MNTRNEPLPFSDEQLSAFVDGELDEQTAARVRAAQAQDMRIARRIAAFAQTGPQLRALFDAELEAPVPEHLVRLLHDKPAPSAGAVVTPLRSRRDWLRGIPLALAASALLAVGVAALLPMLRGGPATPGAKLSVAGMPPDSAVMTAILERVPSGEAVERQMASGSFELLPTASYRDADGRWCRELRSTDLGSGDSAQVLACRERGEWRVQVATTEQYSDLVRDKGYFAAGAPSSTTPAQRHLSMEEEQRLIASGWPE